MRLRNATTAQPNGANGMEGGMEGGMEDGASKGGSKAIARTQKGLNSNRDRPTPPSRPPHLLPKIGGECVKMRTRAYYQNIPR